MNYIDYDSHILPRDPDPVEGSGTARIKVTVQYKDDDGEVTTDDRTLSLGVYLEDEGSPDELIKAANESGELAADETAINAELLDWEPDEGGPEDRYED